MKYYSLILTNKFNKVNKDENLLSTKICKDFLNVNDLSKDYKFNNISRKEILKRYGFCEKIYKKLIIDLKKELNRVHNLNYSVRSWDIIIGRWLRDFIQISYKSYLELTYVLKNYKVNKFYIFDKKKFSLNVNDTISQEIASADQQWAYCLSSLLIESIKPNGKFITISPKNYSFELKKNYKISFASIFNSKLIFKIINFSKLLINYNNYALITKTYLPFKSEKLLEIKFRQIPLMWPEISIKYNKKNELLRNSLKLKKS